MITQQFLLFGGVWASLMFPPAASMFMTSIMLLWCTSDSVPLPL